MTWKTWIVGVVLWWAPVMASAHPLDVAYIDVGASATSTAHMTVAVHPYQAFEIVRAGSSARFELSKIQQNGDLISAYIQEHVQIVRDGQACAWDAGSAHTPPTELEALGDGITVAGELSCVSSTSPLEVHGSLFIEEFPQQTTIIRLELPDGFAERATLNQTTRVANLSLGELQTSSATSSAMSVSARRPDATEVSLAKRLLDPGIGLWGMIGILCAAIAIGALHALGPGHGKSLIAATLIGERATVRNVLALGTVMTATHVADVLLLTIVAGLISAMVPPTSLLSMLQTASAVGLVGFGIWNLRRAIRQYRRVQKNASHAEDEDAHRRAHELGIPHTHAVSTSQPPRSIRSILWLGFVGSLAPCPTAWAIFMATMSVGRPGAGLLLLVAFTIGLYATILLIGLLLITSSAFAAKHTPPKFTYALPIVSAMIITGLGIAVLIKNWW